MVAVNKCRIVNLLVPQLAGLCGCVYSEYLYYIMRECKLREARPGKEFSIMSLAYIKDPAIFAFPASLSLKYPLLLSHWASFMKGIGKREGGATSEGRIMLPVDGIIV